MVGRGCQVPLVCGQRWYQPAEHALVLLSAATSWSPATVLKTYIPSTAPCLQHLICLQPETGE